VENNQICCLFTVHRSCTQPSQ